jgi:hypothetical protein
VKKLMNDLSVGEIINACDAGREGELIFRLVYEKAACTLPIKRLCSLCEDTHKIHYVPCHVMRREQAQIAQKVTSCLKHTA